MLELLCLAGLGAWVGTLVITNIWVNLLSHINLNVLDWIMGDHLPSLYRLIGVGSGCLTLLLLTQVFRDSVLLGTPVGALIIGFVGAIVTLDIVLVVRFLRTQRQPVTERRTPPTIQPQ
ncbi:MAG TPA: hypothetical protein V6C85_32920 [Allocoleopsis sp.]